MSDRTVHKVHQTKFADMHHPDCQERQIATSNYRSSMGRSTVDVTCPFCNRDTTAYVWSLPNGKRCGNTQCGAIFGQYCAYKLEKKNV